MFRCLTEHCCCSDAKNACIGPRQVVAPLYLCLLSYVTRILMPFDFTSSSLQVVADVGVVLVGVVVGVDVALVAGVALREGAAVEPLEDEEEAEGEVEEEDAGGGG